MQNTHTHRNPPARNKNTHVRVDIEAVHICLCGKGNNTVYSESSASRRDVRNIL